MSSHIRESHDALANTERRIEAILWMLEINPGSDGNHAIVSGRSIYYRKYSRARVTIKENCESSRDEKLLIGMTCDMEGDSL
jgi:hypothetical protein